MHINHRIYIECYEETFWRQHLKKKPCIMAGIEGWEKKVLSKQ